MHDDSIKNKILDFASNKDAHLHISPTHIKADKADKKPEKDITEKPSKAQSEYEQFLIDWEPGDPLPLFPPGKILKLCSFSGNDMVNGGAGYIDNPATTRKPYKGGKKSAEEEFIEFKNLGPKIKEGLLSLLGRVARSRGLWIDDKNKLRCPPGTPAANQFTDITGANCWIPSPQTAAQSGARAARRAFGTAEAMAAQTGQRIDVSPAGRSRAAARYSMDDFETLVAGMDISGRIGVPRALRGARGGSTATRRTVPNEPQVVSLIAKREAIARGRELTAQARELEQRFSINSSNPVRLPSGKIVGDVTVRQDFLAAMQELTPNVPIEEWAEYFDNALPGFLSMTDRRKYQLGWAAYWRNQILEMIDNREDFKFLTRVTINESDDIAGEALAMKVEPFAPEPASGGRNVGVGPMGLVSQTNQSGRKLIAEGGFHFTMNINPVGMWTQMNNWGRDMHSDAAGMLDSIEGRAHYIATHETGHVVDFAQKLRALGLDPDAMKANGDYYGTTKRVVNTSSGIRKQPEYQSNAWKVDWSKISNPMNNPEVQNLIDAAERLKNTQYAGSRFSGRKIDLQNDLNEFYNLIGYAFFYDINQTEDDNHFMATLAGNKYAHSMPVEARAEFYAFRRLFGELRGTRPATQTAQFGSNLESTPTPGDIAAGTVVMTGTTPSNWNLLTRFVDIYSDVEVQRLREAGRYNSLASQAAVTAAEALDRQSAAEQTMRRIQDLGVNTFGKNPNAWNISGRLGQVDDGNQRPAGLHAQRVRNYVRSSNIATRRSRNNGGVSYDGITGRMGNPDPVKPQRPREPDNGPFTGKFLDVLRGSATWKDFAKKYRKETVVFFDYETTGFGEDGNMPVQIGAVKMKGGKVVERFNVFVNPGIPLGDWAKKNLKDDKGQPLTDEWLASKASLKDAHEQLIEFFGDSALLGGQYTPFDLEVLERVLKQVGLEYKPAGVIDSKAMADELLPRWTPDNPDGPTMVDPKTGAKKASNSLGPLAEYLEVDLGDGWHTADADSEASAIIIEKILDRAISRKDTSQRLLDVDQVPIIVQERRAQYERDLADYQRKKAEYDQLISGKMGVAQFETANGSVYTRQKDGRFHRKKSATLGTTMDDAESTFDNTVFVNGDDAYNVMAQGQRGPIIDKDGDLVGRYYDDSGLDSDEFMKLRRSGEDFDSAYVKAGGKVESKKIPASRISQEPQTGLQPIEWNKNDNKFHVGSPVSSITMESSSDIVGRIGNPVRASKARTVQVNEAIAASKSSVGAGMDDKYIDEIWPEISARLNVSTKPPLKKSEKVARRREWSKWFAENLRASIGSEGNDPRETPLSQYLIGTEIDFQAHLASLNDDEMEQEILDAVSEFHAGIDPRPRVQVPHQDLTRIIANGYKTTHEVDSDHSPSPIRKAYEATIGIHPDVPNNLRPASGYVMHSDWLDAEDKAAVELLDALPGANPDDNFPEFMQRVRAESKRGPVHVYGGVELVLRPETAGRTFYGVGDSLSERVMPVSMESTDIDEIAQPLTGYGAYASRGVIEMLHGKWSGNYASQRYTEDGVFRPYHEALIMGSFDANDIEQVIFSDTDSIPLAALTESGSLSSRRAGLEGSNGNFDRDQNIPNMAQMLDSQYWVDNENMSLEDAEDAVKVIRDNGLLKISKHPNQVKGLAAAKIRHQLEAAGIKMVVRNKQGLDYFDPKKWIAEIEAETVEQAIEAKIRKRTMAMIREIMSRGGQ